MVALQELDSMTHRSGQKYVLGEIAGRTQMHAYFAPAIDMTEENMVSDFTKEIPVSLKLMTLPGRGRSTCADYGRVRQLHLLLHPSVSPKKTAWPHWSFIKDFAAAHKNLFPAGDPNAEPESAFIKYLQQDFQILSDVNQHISAPAPTETIDYITALKQNMKGFTVTSAQVVNELVASDHCPLVVVL